MELEQGAPGVNRRLGFSPLNQAKLESPRVSEVSWILRARNYWLVPVQALPNVRDVKSKKIKKRVDEKKHRSRRRAEGKTFITYSFIHVHAIWSITFYKSLLFFISVNIKILCIFHILLLMLRVILNESKNM